MSTKSDSYIHILQAELSRRISANSRYSLRAFARDLAISPSRVSEILQGKQGLSRVKALKIAKALGLTHNEQQHFCDLVDSAHARSESQRALARIRLQKVEVENQQLKELNEDTFRIISDWHHLAIMELTYVKGFNKNPKWIGHSLGISEIEAKLAVDRLLRLGLLKHENNKLVCAADISIPGGAPSDAIKNFHKTVLMKAQSALYTHAVEDRDFSVVLFAMRRDRLSEAKQWLRTFRRKFMSDLEKSGEADSVFCLSTQFFEVTKNGYKKDQGDL